MIVGLSQEKCGFLYMQAKQHRRYVHKKLLISVLCIYVCMFVNNYEPLDLCTQPTSLQRESKFLVPDWEI
jgi:hypothetical protein